MGSHTTTPRRICRKTGLVLGLLSTSLLLGACTKQEEQPPADVQVKISGVVYDAELSGASVDLVVGNTVAASAITDASGAYELDVTVKEADAEKMAFLKAARGGFKLRSVLGSATEIEKARDDNGVVHGNRFAAANVTNVSTAVAAILEQQNNGAIPASQTGLDTALAAIRGDAALKTKVTQIAAAVKAVIDYGATNSAADTDTLAKNLAGSANLATDLNTVITTSGKSEADLIAEVESDPTLAVQIPSTITPSNLAGKYYSVGQDTLVYFDSASTLIMADYDDVINGRSPAGTFSADDTNGTFTMSVTNTTDNSIMNIVASNISGTLDAIQMDISVDGVDQGRQLMRRLEPMNTTGSNITSAMFEGKVFVDFKGSKALRTADVCDNLNTTGWMANTTGKLTASCDTHLGMLIVTPSSAPQMVLGVLSDAWDSTGGKIRQAMTTVKWEPASAGVDPDTTYHRIFQPVDSGIPQQYNSAGTGIIGSLRIIPATNEAQIMFVTANDTGSDDNATGSIDLYLLNADGTYSTNEKNHVIQSTHVDTGTLVVNGSTKRPTFSEQHASVSVSMNLGKHAGGKMTALYKPYQKDASGQVVPLGSIRGRLQYALQAMASTDVESKTFKLRNMNDAADVSTLSFGTAAEGTGTLTNSNGTENFTWAIGPSVDGTPTASPAYTDSALVMTMTDGRVNYLFADKTAGAGNMILARYQLSAAGLDEVAGYVAIVQ